ncbi:MAG: hypothetical protein A2285_07655 [Elusimicrobia bacterium RIFOXYA12_FULL_57_11]|nr:MAG: hypothetical protein A2285_07655 [Elusimicrobia bacterium RIFOXYA12_FULL_57_11]
MFAVFLAAGPAAQAATSASFKNQDLLNIFNDSKTLYGDQDTLGKRINTIKNYLGISATALGMLSTLDADLRKLEASAKTLQSAAMAAEAIPQAREKAGKIKASLGASLKEITAARIRMDAIVAKTEPLRLKLAEAEDKAEKLGRALYLINSGFVKKFPRVAQAAETCLGRLPADTRACADPNVSKYAVKLDQALVDYDKVVQVLIYTPDSWLPSVDFFNPFGTEIAEIDSLRKQIEALYGRVEGLSKNLSGLNTLVNSSFSFSFPYPTVTGMSSYKVSIGFKTIMDGADAIEGNIKSVLSSFLWEVLSRLGLGGYVDSLIKQANNALNAILDAVDADISLGLPDMAALNVFETDELKLEAGINALKLPSVGMDVPNFGLPGLNLNLGEIEKLFSSLAPNGLELGNPDLCKNVTFGCN